MFTKRNVNHMQEPTTSIAKQQDSSGTSIVAYSYYQQILYDLNLTSACTSVHNGLNTRETFTRIVARILVIFQGIQESLTSSKFCPTVVTTPFTTTLPLVSTARTPSYQAYKEARFLFHQKYISIATQDNPELISIPNISDSENNKTHPDSTQNDNVAVIQPDIDTTVIPDSDNPIQNIYISEFSDSESHSSESLLLTTTNNILSSYRASSAYFSPISPDFKTDPIIGNQRLKFDQPKYSYSDIATDYL
ncbi:unnamed protein product [Allacma fusca]|uniref:Uncharacterized protein n=1 Tax=Allacma fusca TaxID=39272 RepID=A0A8J2K441_9HEXA|nr:unnamed protein product [Allacma fusca]